MKVCFTIGNLTYSGAEKIMYHLLNELSIRGHEVSVILVDCDEEYTDLEKVKQFPIYDKIREADRNRFIRVIKRQQRIRESVKKSGCNLLVSFGVGYNVDVIQACHFMNIKIILCERSDPIHHPDSKLLRIRRKIFYRRADAFVFQTKEIKKFFSKAIQARAIVIPNFIEKRVPEENLNIEKRNSFVTCSRLDNKSKNHLLLISAFYKFNKINSNYKLEFYGDGPDRAQYEQLIKELGMYDNIILHGRIDNPMEEAKKCKFFILSSKYEGMPNALIEALAYGMPCIAADCSGGAVRELINNEENGLIVPYNDEKSLLEAMLRLAADDELADSLAKEAYKINDTLEMGRIVDIWEHFLENYNMER